MFNGVQSSSLLHNRYTGHEHLVYYAKAKRVQNI